MTRGTRSARRSAGACPPTPARVDSAALRGSPVLGGLPPPALGRLVARLRRRHYCRGEVVLRQGEPGDTLHLVLEGRLKGLVVSPSGEEVVLRVFGPGDLFGALSVLDGGPHSATVVALEPVYTATLARADLQALLRQSPEAVEGLLRTLVGLIRRHGERLVDILALDLPGRLANVLLELAQAHGRQIGDAIHIEARLTQEDLAGMIGGTRATVNKLLGQFEAQGAIARSGRRIAIVDAGALRLRARS